MDNSESTPTTMIHNLKPSKNSEEHIYDTKMQVNYQNLPRE